NLGGVTMASIRKSVKVAVTSLPVRWETAPTPTVKDAGRTSVVLLNSTQLTPLTLRAAVNRLPTRRRRTQALGRPPGTNCVPKAAAVPPVVARTMAATELSPGGNGVT